MSDLQEELAESGRPRVGKLTIALAGLVVLAIGVGGGVLIGRTTAAGAGAGPGGRGAGLARFEGSGVPTPGATGFGGGAGGSGGGRNGNVVAGTIEKVSGSTITVKQFDGTTVTIRTSSKTSVAVTKPGGVSDLEQGQTILVQGTKGSDNSITARSVTEGNRGSGFGRRITPPDNN